MVCPDIEAISCYGQKKKIWETALQIRQSRDLIASAKEFSHGICVVRDLLVTSSGSAFISADLQILLTHILTQ